MIVASATSEKECSMPYAVITSKAIALPVETALNARVPLDSIRAPEPLEAKVSITDVAPFHHNALVPSVKTTMPLSVTVKEEGLLWTLESTCSNSSVEGLSAKAS